MTLAKKWYDKWHSSPHAQARLDLLNAMMRSNDFSQRYTDEGNTVDYYFFVDGTCILDRSNSDSAADQIVLDASIGTLLAVIFGEINDDTKESRLKEALEIALNHK